MTIKSFTQIILNNFYPQLAVKCSRPLEKSHLVHLISRQGEFILKKHTPLIYPHVEELNTLYEYCSREHLIPEMLPSISSRSIIRYKGDYFSIQKMVTSTHGKIDPWQLGKKISQLHDVFLDVSKTTCIENHLSRTVNNIQTHAQVFGYHEFVPFVKTFFEQIAPSSTQIIHGDLHEKNIITSKNNIFFIDIDSATTHTPILDVAFSTFRIFRQDMDQISICLESYNTHSKAHKITMRQLWYSLIYLILQRILFIRIEAKRGNKEWLVDLKNQETYLGDVLIQKPHYFMTKN